MNFLTDWFDKTLIPEWRKALKMLSVQWGLICVAAAPVWDALPEDKRASLLAILGISPAWYVAAAVGVGIVLRLKGQGIGQDEPDKKDPTP
jgi:hypothetical protein